MLEKFEVSACALMAEVAEPAHRSAAIIAQNSSHRILLPIQG